MKTKLRFYAFSISIAFILGMSVNSCTKEQSALSPTSPNQENLQLKDASVPAPALDVVCDLVAGQTIPAGQVVISNDGTSIFIKYVTTGGWGLSEVHVYVGDVKDVPVNKQNIPVIGHFPYSATNLGGVTEYTVTVPISDLGTETTDGYAVFAHAVVVNGDQQQTAWSNGCSYKPLFALKTKMIDPKLVTAGIAETWACSDGDLLFSTTNTDNWCHWLGTNIYNGPEDYDLISSWYQPGEAGHIHVDEVGQNLEVTVYASEGLTLIHSYLYIGTMEGLKSDLQNECPFYSHFPYQIEVESDTHSFTVPLPAPVSEKSFQSYLGINRWGWFFFYKI